MSDEDVLQMNEEDDLQLYHQATHMNDEDVLQLFKFADQVLGGANYNWQSIEDNTVRLPFLPTPTRLHCKSLQPVMLMSRHRHCTLHLRLPLGTGPSQFLW